ncbi:SinI family restriction endonuclease [Zobellia nedashkovskayae]|uniref:SinI family restriction endonuclease n=1 Tax=Zobellia nedashkovskayae TaxID=2779510 RepID=UPI00188A8670|nr:SinI family restriction endonuclease [Zobellia nedashkovskayae]
MDATTQFDEKDFTKVLSYAKEFAGASYDNSLEVVISTAFKDVRNLPKLGYPKKGKSVVPLREYVHKLTRKYLTGFDGRPSKKIGNKSATFSDPALKLALGIVFDTLSTDQLDMVIEGHSALMSLENLIGELLEEYLCINLVNYGWHCCWGSSLLAVDFCQDDGRLLQVKNSDNSENSSSSKVRNGTTIQKWARRKSSKENTFYWEKLEDITKVKGLNESDFQKFVKFTLSRNSTAIYKDASNKFLK